MYVWPNHLLKRSCVYAPPILVFGMAAHRIGAVPTVVATRSSRLRSVPTAARWSTGPNQRTVQTSRAISLR